MPCCREDYRVVVPRSEGTPVFFFACGRVVSVSSRPPRWFAGGVLKTDGRLFQPGLLGHFSVVHYQALLLHLVLDSSDYHGTLVFARSFVWLCALSKNCCGSLCAGLSF